MCLQQYCVYHRRHFSDRSKISFQATSLEPYPEESGFRPSPTPSLADVLRTVLVIATTPREEALLFPVATARPALEAILEHLSVAWTTIPPPEKEVRLAVTPHT